MPCFSNGSFILEKVNSLPILHQHLLSPGLLPTHTTTPLSFFPNCVLLYAFPYRTPLCFLACTGHAIQIISYESHCDPLVREHMAFVHLGLGYLTLNIFFQFHPFPCKSHFSLQLSNSAVCTNPDHSSVTSISWPVTRAEGTRAVIPVVGHRV